VIRVVPFAPLTGVTRRRYCGFMVVGRHSGPRLTNCQTDRRFWNWVWCTREYWKLRIKPPKNYGENGRVFILSGVFQLIRSALKGLNYPKLTCAMAACVTSAETVKRTASRSDSRLTNEPHCQSVADRCSTAPGISLVDEKTCPRTPEVRVKSRWSQKTKRR